MSHQHEQPDQPPGHAHHDDGAHRHGDGAGHDGGHRHGASAPDVSALPQEPRAFWEARYGGAPVWSGKVNATMAALVADLTPGRSLDLGAGEGGDVIHLAEAGWDAAGVDISEAAVARARAAAVERGVAGEDGAAGVAGAVGAGRARFLATDLTDTSGDWGAHDDGAAGYDLITGSFFQSPVELDRARILRHARDLLAPGGRLVLVSHAAPPSWAPAQMAEHGDFPSPVSELALLGVPAEGDDAWEVLTAEVRRRPATGPDGEAATLDDTVVVVRRRG